MNAVPQNLVSVDQFFSWLANQEGRFELVNGQIRMMTGATYRHNQVKNNVTVALTPLARACGCRSTTSDTGVQTGEHGIRYPDVVIDRGPQSPTSMTVSNPVIVVEISSPSTRGTDLGVKLYEYQNLDAVQIIIQIEPDVIDVAIHRRTAGGGWAVEVYQSADAVIDLPPLKGSLAVADIYFGLDVANIRGRWRRPLIEGVDRPTHL